MTHPTPQKPLQSLLNTSSARFTGFILLTAGLLYVPPMLGENMLLRSLSETAADVADYMDDTNTETLSVKKSLKR